MTYKRFAFLSVAFLFLAIASCFVLSQFYDRYQRMAENLEQTHIYDDSTANAIKHATAASDMYTLLSAVMSDRLAEETVIRMGVVNEYIEQAIYPNDRDPAREIMKDLHNNYVGITAARLADHEDAFKLILAFASNRTLIVNKTYNPFFEEKEPKQDVVAFGYDWFGEHRNEIDSRIQKKFLRTKDYLFASPIQVSSLIRRLTFVE